MRKNFILDTSVLLYNPQAIYSFAENDVIIPIEVIEELDSFKRDLTDLGRNSRTIIKSLDRFRQQGKLGEGIKLENGGLLRIYAGVCEDVLPEHGLHLGDVFESKILNLAIHLTHRDPDSPTIIITKNMNLRLKADALGIYAEDYEDRRQSFVDYYTGWHKLTRSIEDITTLQKGGSLTIDDRATYHPNEYILLAADQEDDLTAVGRIDADCQTILPLKALPEAVVGIRPRNLEQAFALDALLDEDIRLVTLQGKAGTGKSLLAVAAGLCKVLVDDAYNRVLISRPTVPMGRDIGYLPGEIQEKLRPWMQPIYDAIELIREVDRRSRQRSLPPDILESEEIGIEPLTYIRGRSIPHQFMIIDEAQNLTPLEIKTIVTRVGRGTKLVLTGDPEQIDNPYVDSMSNGFISLVNRFRHQSISAHITLSKGERSRLAEIAANLL